MPGYVVTMPSDPSSPEPDPLDPLGLGKLFGSDVFGALQRMMSWSGGPVNWDLAEDVARRGVADDPAVTDDQRRAVGDAGRLAELWLDPLTTLPGSAGAPQAWTRAEWLRTTLPAWKQLVEPVAGRVTQALGILERGLHRAAGGLEKSPTGPCREQHACGITHHDLSQRPTPSRVFS